MPTDTSVNSEVPESADSYLHLLITVNPTDFINSSDRAAKIIKLFSEHYLPLPFSLNEDKSDLTEETKLILMVPYFIGLSTLQIQIPREPNKPIDMEQHRMIRSMQLKQAKMQFVTFLKLVTQYEQLSDEYLSWVMPIVSDYDLDEEDEELLNSASRLQKSIDPFQKLMHDRNQMVLRLRAKNLLEKNLFENVESLDDGEVSRLTKVRTNTDDEPSQSGQDDLKRKALSFELYIQYCALDSLEQLTSIQREEEMFTMFSAQKQQQPQPQTPQTNQPSRGISHVKATSLNDIMSNRSNLSQMGYNMIVLPDSNSNKSAGRGSTKGGNSLQKAAIAKATQQSFSSTVASSAFSSRNAREEMKNKVFGSYVPGPTVSLEEFARQEMHELHERQEREKQHEQQNQQKKQDDEKEEDEQELKKKRAWDDWKDDHVKGSGNMRD